MGYNEERINNLESVISNLEQQIKLLGDRHNKDMETIEKIKQIVFEQAEDEGLWFDAQTAPEAYLQAELRRLHAVIEEQGK